MEPLKEDEEELRPAALAELAGTIARRAGRLLMDNLPFGRFRGTIETKEHRELVSRVDRESEELILEHIAAAYPDHALLGEEGGARLAPLDEARYRWIVDPLDGTTNYLHGHPFFAVSIGVERLPHAGALARVERAATARAPELVAAAVFAPYFGELFLAARGMGAFLNTPVIELRVSDTETLEKALVATGFAYDRGRWPNDERFVRASEATRGVRRCGAAALDLAYVAAGRYDGFWELGLKAHDVAAGALLVQEAGGRVSDLKGGNDWLTGGHIVAAGPSLFEPLRALIA